MLCVSARSVDGIGDFKAGEKGVGRQAQSRGDVNVDRKQGLSAYARVKLCLTIETIDFVGTSNDSVCFLGEGQGSRCRTQYHVRCYVWRHGERNE